MTAAGPALAAVTGHVVLADALASLAARLQRVTARVHTRGRGRFSGVGAGVLWPGAEQGLVVTNAHVVMGARGRWPIVELADGRSFEARLAARDEEQDLALLALERTDPPLDAATLGDARAMRVGELVVALGHPLGIASALSVGVVHAVRGDGWLRADIRLAPGNSGGPLATLDGAIVGINSMVVRGLGIAIPTQRVVDFVAAAVRERDGLDSSRAAEP